MLDARKKHARFVAILRRTQGFMVITIYAPIKTHLENQKKLLPLNKNKDMTIALLEKQLDKERENLQIYRHEATRVNSDLIEKLKAITQGSGKIFITGLIIFWTSTMQSTLSLKKHRK